MDTTWIYAVIAAGGTSLLMLWAQVRGVWAQAISRVIVSAECSDESVAALMLFLNTKCQRSRWGTKAYGGIVCYVRSKRERELVTYETLGSTPQLFWYGRMPIVAKIKTQQGDGHGEWQTHSQKVTLSITSIRMLKSLESIVAEATLATNAIAKSRSVGRFRVVKPDERVFLGTTGLNGAMTLASQRLLTHTLDEIQRDSVPCLPNTFDGLVVTETVQKLNERWQWWYGDRKWFEERRLAWRDGWLLYGPPGTGKTSVVRAIARRYDVPIYAIDLSKATNEMLNKTYEAASSNSPSIVLMEDIDTYFIGRKNRDADKKAVTFEGMLEALDGAESYQGVVTVLTTNHVESLDPALVRPGRMNVRIEVPFLTVEEQRQLIDLLLGKWAHLMPEPAAPASAAEVTMRCLEIAVRMKAEAPANCCVLQASP